jgi:hypothetical protein
MDVLAPLILLVVLVWLALRSRRRRTGGDVTKRGTRDLYDTEEERRREGTDDL